MQVTIVFENGIRELRVTPENAREKQLLDLAISGAPSIGLKATTTDSVVIVFKES